MNIASGPAGYLSGRRYAIAARVAVGAMMVMLITLPFAHSVAVRTIALGIALCAVAIAWRAFRVPRVPMLWYFALLAIIGGLSLVWSVDPEYSRGELKTELLYPFLVFTLMFALTRDRRTLLWWGAAIALAIVLSVSGPFFAWIDPATGRPARGVLYNGAGFYSTWVVVVYPFALTAGLSTALAPRWRLVAFALTAAAVAAGYVTLNRSFPFAIAVETCAVVTWYTFTRRSPRRYLPLALAAAFAAVLLAGLVGVQKERRVISPGHDEDVVVSVQRDMRWALWSEALERISAKPLRGAGFGRGILRHELPKRYGNTYLWHAHNVVLNYGLQMGVPGLALILALFGAALWHLARAYRASDDALRPYIVAAMVMVLGVFLKNQTDDFFVRQTALAFWAALGAVLGVTARLQPAPESARGRVKSPRFLIIRRDNIGDLVCTTPLFTGLRRRYPNAWIGVVANSYNAPVLDGNPDIDAVFAYRKAKHGETGLMRAAWHRVRLLAALRREALDYAIVATPADRDRGLAIARLAGAKHVLAFVGRGVTARGVDMALPLNDIDGQSEVELVWRIARALGVEGEPPPTTVIAPADVAERARAAIAARAWSARGPLVAVHLSARKASQRWPAERFAALMRALHTREDARFIVFWAPGEESTATHPGDDAKARAVLEATADLPVIGWPTLELRELVGALAICDRAVLADGGAMHIAAALGKPLVALFGNSDARRWRPWGVPHEILQADSRTVEAIEVDAVLNACARLPPT